MNHVIDRQFVWDPCLARKIRPQYRDHVEQNLTGSGRSDEQAPEVPVYGPPRLLRGQVVGSAGICIFLSQLYYRYWPLAD